MSWKRACLNVPEFIRGLFFAAGAVGFLLGPSHGSFLRLLRPRLAFIFVFMAWIDKMGVVQGCAFLLPALVPCSRHRSFRLPNDILRFVRGPIVPMSFSTTLWFLVDADSHS